MIGKIYKLIEVIWNILLAFYRDIFGIIAFAKLEKLIKKNTSENQTVYKIFRENVRIHPNKECIIYNDQVWTFQDVNISFLHIILYDYDLHLYNHTFFEG